MAKAKITPKNLLRFNKKSVNEDDDEFIITADNIMEHATSDNVSDAMKNLYGEHGFVKGLKPVSPEFRAAGFLRTVTTDSDDWGTCIKGIYACDRDEILLVKCSDNDLAVWGGLASFSAQKHGLKATVIIGSTRDTRDILDMGYPVFSRDIRSCAGLPLNRGTIDEAIYLDGMIIESGDFIVCDVDGVVTVPADRVEEVLEEVNSIVKFEKDCIKRVSEDNEHLDDIIGL